MHLGLLELVSLLYNTDYVIHNVNQKYYDNFKMSVVEALITVTVIRVKEILVITAMATIQLMILRLMKILVATQAAVIPILVVMLEVIPITTQL